MKTTAPQTTKIIPVKVKGIKEAKQQIKGHDNEADLRKLDKEHLKRAAPTVQIIETFLSKVSRFDRAAHLLSGLLSVGDKRPNVQMAEDCENACNEVLLLITDPTVSGRLPVHLHGTIGKTLNDLKDFFHKISESEAIQAEVDLHYLWPYYRRPEDIAEVWNDYQPPRFIMPEQARK